MKLPFGFELSRQRPARRRSSVGRRNFAGAKQDRLTADWLLGGQGINETLAMQLPTLRFRSRDLARNNPFVKKFIRALRRNVIGPHGLALQVQSSDVEANEAIERAWKRAGRSKALDITGRLTWVQMQQLALATMAKDGEVLNIKHEGEGPLGIAFQLVDPAGLDVGLRNELAGGKRIRMGIELDSLDRPLGYHIIQAEPGTQELASPAHKWKRIPAADVIHAFLADEVGQLRGIPWMHAVILRLKMLGASDEASLVALRVGASTMGFLESTGEPGGGADGYAGEDDQTADGEPIFDVEPGTFRSLPLGRKVSMWKPEYPTSEYAPFHKAMLHGIAAGLDAAYSTISGDLREVNFSSLRQGIIDERDTWKDLQGLFAWDFVQPCYVAWLRMQLMRGAIKTRSGRVLQLADLEQYLDVEWAGRRWQWVDPLKDVQAAKIEVDERFRSRSSVIREQGGDARDTWKEVAEENALLEQLGIDLPSSSGSAPAVSDPEDENEDPEAAEKGARWWVT